MNNEDIIKLLLGIQMRANFHSLILLLHVLLAMCCKFLVLRIRPANIDTLAKTFTCCLMSQLATN